jgi:hypothetical protein
MQTRPAEAETMPTRPIEAPASGGKVSLSRIARPAELFITISV